MTDKKVIWVGGDRLNEDSLRRGIDGQRYFEDTETMTSVGEVVPAIDSGNYRGLFIRDLWVPIKGDLEKYRLNALENKRQWGGGLYIVRYCVENDFPVLANALAGDELEDLVSLGVKTLDWMSLPADGWRKEFKRKFEEIFGSQ